MSFNFTSVQKNRCLWTAAKWKKMRDSPLMELNPEKWCVIFSLLNSRQESNAIWGGSRTGFEIREKRKWFSSSSRALSAIDRYYSPYSRYCQKCWALNASSENIAKGTNGGAENCEVPHNYVYYRWVSLSRSTEEKQHLHDFTVSEINLEDAVTTSKITFLSTISHHSRALRDSSVMEFTNSNTAQALSGVN